MLSVTFAQPYGWGIGGESNIRQLMRGIELTREYFPKSPQFSVTFWYWARRRSGCLPHFEARRCEIAWGICHRHATRPPYDSICLRWWDRRTDKAISVNVGFADPEVVSTDPPAA